MKRAAAEAAVLFAGVLQISMVSKASFSFKSDMDNAAYNRIIPSMAPNGPPKFAGCNVSKT